MRYTAGTHPEAAGPEVRPDRGAPLSAPAGGVSDAFGLEHADESTPLTAQVRSLLALVEVSMRRRAVDIVAHAEREVERSRSEARILAEMIAPYSAADAQRVLDGAERSAAAQRATAEELAREVLEIAAVHEEVERIIAQATADRKAQSTLEDTVGAPAASLMVTQVFAQDLHQRPSDEPGSPTADAIGGIVVGGIEVVAGPFTRFAHLADFSRDLRALPGIVSVETSQFYRGTVHLRVRYDNPVPLATSVLSLACFAPQVISATPQRIELMLHIADASQSAPDHQSLHPVAPQPDAGLST